MVSDSQDKLFHLLLGLIVLVLQGFKKDTGFVVLVLQRLNISLGHQTRNESKSRLSYEGHTNVSFSDIDL